MYSIVGVSPYHVGASHSKRGGNYYELVKASNDGKGGVSQKYREVSERRKGVILSQYPPSKGQCPRRPISKPYVV
jgi:hypothetical protein